MAPGETRSAEVSLAPGSVLRFALGLGESPDVGFLRFRVSVAGKTVYERRLFAGRNRNHWWDVAVPLAADGPATIVFGGEHERGASEAEAPGAKPERPWIVLASARVEVPGPQARRRVLVWISQDTVRADHVGAYGYQRKTTPAFDALAPGWVVFDKAASPASWTLPALVSQFTSRYPTFHGAVGASVQRDESQPTLFEILAASGFTVLGVTGNHFVSPEFRTAGGFDVLNYTEGHAEDVDRLAADALGEWGGGDLALFVHYMDPHAPYDPPPRYGRLFDPGYRGKVTGRNFNGLPRSAFAPADVDHVRALYDGELAYEDLEIGELLDLLHAKGLLEGAVIVYSADHGEEFLEHGGWEHSHTLYEEMLHVPFALRVPGVAGRRVAPLVSTIDLAPTVLEALGLASPPSFQGRSLMPAARGGHVPEIPVFAETERTLDGNHRVAVRAGMAKCILVARPGRDVPPQVLSEECYDLAGDPGEARPLPASAERARLRDQAVAYLSRARQEARAQKPAELPPEVQDRLRALGYLQ